MNKRRWTGVLAFSLGLNLMLAGAWLVGQPHQEDKRPGKHEQVRHFFEIPPEKLDLNPTQLKQWEAIRRSQDRESLQMRKRSLERLEQLGEILMREDATTVSLQRLIGEMNEGAVDYAAKLLETYLQQREILDSAQEQKLRTILREQIAGMREMTQRRFEYTLKDLKQKYGEPFVSEAIGNTTSSSELKGDHHQ